MAGGRIGDASASPHEAIKAEIKRGRQQLWQPAQRMFGVGRRDVMLYGLLAAPLRHDGEFRRDVLILLQLKADATSLPARGLQKRHQQSAEFFCLFRACIEVSNRAKALFGHSHIVPVSDGLAPPLHCGEVERSNAWTMPTGRRRTSIRTARRSSRAP